MEIIEYKRKLASIEQIAEVKNIENADLIQSYRVLGWWVVGKKDEYKVGDKIVYFSIDSWIPHELAPFLSKSKEARKYNGVEGERLKTIRLRKVLSQGLVLPLNILDGKVPDYEDLEQGTDLTSILGIQKWEREIPAQLQGQVKSNFPTHLVSKTDEERCISKGTFIFTDKGPILIEQIAKDISQYNVLTRNHKTNINEYKPIISAFVQENNNDWYKIKTKSGKELIVTSNHPIFLSDKKCYRETCLLTRGDKIIINN